MDISFFKENGYQIVKGLIDVNVIEDIRGFLEEEKDLSLNQIKSLIPFKDYGELVEKTRKAFEDKNKFDSMGFDEKKILCGHFRLEASLSEKLLEIPKNNNVRKLISLLLPNQNHHLHLPPAARFILKNNEYAGVPNHQDISYNKHLDDFVIMWVPFVNIDDDCGGVLVHHGSGFLKEQLTNFEKKFWLNGIPAEGFKEVHCKMQPGDVLLLNKYVIHRSMANVSNRIRYSVDYRFFGENTTSLKHYYDLKNSKTVAPS